MKRIMTRAAGAGVTRRGLLQGTGAALSLAALGATPSRAFAERRWDLVIIGGGTAGLPAAIEAAARGARVLVIDKAPQLGGTLHVSTGQMSGAGTVFQARAGIEDSAEAHYADAMRINRNTGDPAITRLWTQHAGETLNWLAEHGFDIGEDQPVYGQAHEPYETRRYLWAPEGGRAILEVLLRLLEPHVAAGRVELMLGTGAVELIKSRQGRVTGVVVEDEDGRRQDVQGAEVLLAAGGCAANPRMYEDLHGVPLYCQAAWPYSQGQGLMLGLGAGGQLHGGDRYLGLFGAVMADTWTPAGLDFSLGLYADSRPPWELYVNVHGQRFIREDEASVHERELALDDQPGHRFWVVFDEATLANAPSLVPGWSEARLRERFEDHPMLFSAPTLASLALRAGIHPRGLEASVAEYNARREAGATDPLGREYRPVSLDQGPYYAIQCQGWTLVSFAGLVVDDSLRVLDADGQPIPGLTAAGEILGAGATSGKGYVGGALVTPALAFGRLLGARLAAGSA